MEKESSRSPERLPERTDVGDWENTIHHRPISEDLRLLHALFEHLPGPFYMLYIACPDGKLEDILNYVRQQFDVDKEDTIFIEADPQRMDIRVQLTDLASQIMERNGKRILILVKNFELLFQDALAKKDTMTIARRGHDYDQNILQSEELKELFRRSAKKIVIATHIGKSLGEETYETAVRSALGSQFRQGMIEVK